MAVIELESSPPLSSNARGALFLGKHFSTADSISTLNLEIASFIDSVR